MNKNSLDRLAEASAAGPQAANVVWQATHSHTMNPDETPISDDPQQAENSSASSDDTERDVKLHPRAVVVAKETVGNLGGLVRQLSLDQFENESRRLVWSDNYRLIVISTLLRPRNWKPPRLTGVFFLNSYEVGELCYAAKQLFLHEPTVLQLKDPIKVFGDLHGQFGDLIRLFDEYGFLSTAGDIIYIRYIDYLFLGDYVDRGQHSLETITLLLALKVCLQIISYNPGYDFLFTLFCLFFFFLQIQYPENVHFIRGNHEAADINALFGFRLECIERMVISDFRCQFWIRLGVNWSNYTIRGCAWVGF
ncbi:serine/threonine-protein phosphatase BSL1-like [Bidens hawaiensis]|uniref:serine/threonine-protein phosphatase BSL1-like n=1 Tax=Bidens hawaiensis TaxID=980011 RepID=UPI00404A9696